MLVLIDPSAPIYYIQLRSPASNAELLFQFIALPLCGGIASWRAQSFKGMDDGSSTAEPGPGTDGPSIGMARCDKWSSIRDRATSKFFRVWPTLIRGWKVGSAGTGDMSSKCRVFVESEGDIAACQAESSGRI